MVSLQRQRTRGSAVSHGIQGSISIHEQCRTSCEIGNPGDEKVFVEFLDAAGLTVPGRIGPVMRQVQRLWSCRGCHDDRCE